MPDVLTKAQRSALMGRVRRKDTAPETALRSALHRSGFRFRKHVKSLPGTPDIVFTRAKVAVFVDGGFWHGHDFEMWKHKLQPFWKAKIERNIERDRENDDALRAMGWQVLRVWQHEIERNLDDAVDRIAIAVSGDL